MVLLLVWFGLVRCGVVVLICFCGFELDWICGR